MPARICDKRAESQHVRPSALLAAAEDIPRVPCRIDRGRGKSTSRLLAVSLPVWDLEVRACIKYLAATSSILCAVAPGSDLPFFPPGFCERILHPRWFSIAGICRGFGSSPCVFWVPTTGRDHPAFFFGPDSIGLGLPWPSCFSNTQSGFLPLGRVTTARLSPRQTVITWAGTSATPACVDFQLPGYV